MMLKHQPLHTPHPTLHLLHPPHPIHASPPRHSTYAADASSHSTYVYAEAWHVTICSRSRWKRAEIMEMAHRRCWGTPHGTFLAASTKGPVGTTTTWAYQAGNACTPRIDVLNCCTTERDCAGVGKVLGKAYTHASVANAMHVCSDGLWRSSSVAIVPTRATACGQSPSRTASSLEYMLFLPYSNTADKLWVLFCPVPERVEHTKLR